LSSARWLGALLVASLALAAGCSRAPTGADGRAATEGTASTPPASPISASAAAPAVSPRPIPVPTPEDAEEDAAHRITEQNLESELDRLEREIQAE
jgi:hypothetical protein